MSADLDLIVSLFGLLLLSYGIFCAVSQSIWVGFRGLPIKKIGGKRAALISFAYIVGACILVIAGLISWLMPREVFASICIVGGSLPFIGNLDGFLFGK